MVHLREDCWGTQATPVEDMDWEESVESVWATEVECSLPTPHWAKEENTDKGLKESVAEVDRCPPT